MANRTDSTDFGFYKCRCRHHLTGYLAWGALERLTMDDPIREPAEPVHFCFGQTEEEAVSRLTAEMDAAYGKRQWCRQECR